MTVNLTARNATLDDIVGILSDQKARTLDVVVTEQGITATRDGLIKVAGVESLIDADGVTPVDGIYRPTSVFDKGLGDKLPGITVGYLTWMRENRPDLWSANIEGLLHGRKTRRADGSSEVVYAADARKFLLRLFRGDTGGTGIARAFLSDGFGAIDNLDVLTAVLGAVRDAGLAVEVDRCDLTDRCMYVRLNAPELVTRAPELLAGYRSPFDNPDVHATRTHGGSAWSGGYSTTREVGDVVSAGIVIRNSDVGCAAFSIDPVVRVLACKNGMTVEKGLRRVHAGAKLDEGQVQWSAKTHRHNLDLIKSQTYDAVTTWLSPEWLTGAVEQLTEKATVPVADPVKVVESVSKTLGFSKGEQEGILRHFMLGGQATSGGVGQAVTSFAQTIADADRSFDFERSGVRAMELAAVAAR